MKTLYNITLSLLVLLLVGTSAVNAQNFQGIATYKSATSLSLSKAMSSGRLSPEMQQQLAKAMQKEYTLIFNTKESTYKEAEKLEGQTTGSSGGFQVMGVGDSPGIFYKNISSGEYGREADMMGKLFLIKDKLRKYEWQLTEETKKIGTYTCQKATYSYSEKRKPGGGVLMIGGGDEETPEVDSVEVVVNVTAWFTPEIPVSHGPDSYWGLPGLILEVNNGSGTIICEKIVLNPEEGIEIKTPKKGEVVSQAEYNKKQAEMEEKLIKQFKSNGGVRFSNH